MRTLASQISFLKTLSNVKTQKGNLGKWEGSSKRCECQTLGGQKDLIKLIYHNNIEGHDVLMRS